MFCVLWASKLFLICFLCVIPRAKKERTFLSALIKKFLGVLMSIPPSGKREKIHLFPLGFQSGVVYICYHVEFLQQEECPLDFGPISIKEVHPLCGFLPPSIE